MLPLFKNQGFQKSPLPWVRQPGQMLLQAGILSPSLGEVRSLLSSKAQRDTVPERSETSPRSLSPEGTELGRHLAQRLDLRARFLTQTGKELEGQGKANMGVKVPFRSPRCQTGSGRCGPTIPPKVKEPRFSQGLSLCPHLHF